MTGKGCRLALTAGVLLLAQGRAARAEELAGTFQRLGEVFLVNGNASGLARYKDYLYLVMNESTHPLVVYDLHEAGRPKVLGHWPAPGWPMRCRLVGPGWLWTVHGNGEGFFRLDSPAAPRLVTDPQAGPPLRLADRQRFRRHPNMTYQTCAWEDLLFYGTDDQRTEIYRLKGSEATLLATIPSGAPVLLEGQLLAVASGEAPVQIFDVKEPSNPKLLGRLGPKAVPGASLKGSAVAWGDGLLAVGVQRDLPRLFGAGPFAGAQAGVALFDARRWDQLSLLGTAYVPDHLSHISALAYHRGHVYASDNDFGLRVFDVRQAAAPHLVASDRQGGELSALVVLPGRRLAAVAQNLSGSVFIVDVSHPEKPQLLSYFHHGLRTWGQMATDPQERFLYFQGDISRPRPGVSVLFALDLREPRQPRLTAALPGAGRAYGLVTVGQRLYTSAGEIYDISQPERPKKLPQQLPASGYQLAWRAPYLYIAHFEEKDQGKIAVVDLSSAAQPRLVGQLALPMGHRVITMTFLDPYLFLGWAVREPGRKPRGTVLAVDLRQPEQPRLVRQWDAERDLGLTAHYCHVSRLGKLLLVGSYHRCLAAYEVHGAPPQLHCLGRINDLPSAWLAGSTDTLVYRVCLDRLLLLRWRPAAEESEGTSSLRR
jgi:hypothetical protein